MTQTERRVAAELRLRALVKDPLQGLCGQCNCNDLMGGALLLC